MRHRFWRLVPAVLQIPHVEIQPTFDNITEIKDEIS